MEIRKYLSIAAAYKWQLITIPLIAALMAFGATYVVSPRFEGVAVVQVIPDGVEPRTVTLRTEDGPGSLALGLKDPTELLAQGVVESLESQEVARQVTSDLRLTELPPPTGFAAFKSQARALLNDAWALVRFGYVSKKPVDEATVDRVSQSLTAELVRGSYYLNISASWNDPKIAADLANAAVEAVRTHARHVAATSASERAAYLEAQRAEAKRQVEASRAALLQYSTANTIVEGDSLRMAVIGLEQVRTDLRQNDLALIEARQRLEAARQQLAATAPDVVSQATTQSGEAPMTGVTTRTRSPNIVHQSLQERVALLAQEVAALETRQGQSNSEVSVQTELALADARQRLATAEQQLQQSDLSDLVRDQLKTNAFQLQQEIAALAARRDAANASQQTQNDIALSEARRKLSEAQQQLTATNPTVEVVGQTTSRAPSQNGQQTVSGPNPVYQAIERDVQTQEQSIAALEPRKTELERVLRESEQKLRALALSDTQIAALSQDLALANDAYSQRTTDWYNALMEATRPVSPIRLIDPAATPVYPAAPIKIYWVLIGALAGLAVAVVLVFGRHTIDLSLRSGREAEVALEMPLLAVIPFPTGKAAVSSNRTGRGAKV